MKKEKILLPVALLTAIFILNFNGVASAADNNSAVNQITNGLAGGGAGFGTTFQTQLIAPYAINLTLILAIVDVAIKVSFDLIS